MAARAKKEPTTGSYQFTIRLTGTLFCGVRLSGASDREPPEPIGFDYEKARALFGYLLIEPGAHSRASLAALLWPDQPQAAALGALRTTLYRLRRQLEPYGVRFSADRKEIALELPEESRVDLWQLQKLAACCKASEHTPDCIECLKAQAALYRGDLLSDVVIPGALGFEEWLLGAREALRQRTIALLLRLTQALSRSARRQEALGYFEQLLQVDPYSGIACHDQMALLHDLGRSGEALALFRRFERRLKSDLGVVPEEACFALYHRIRHAVLGAPKPPPKADDPGQRVVSVLYLHPLIAEGEQADQQALSSARHLFCQLAEERLARYGAWVVSAGAGLLAFFGHTRPVEQSIRHAAEAAIELQLLLVREMPDPIRPVLALHSGVVLAHPTLADPAGVASQRAMAIALSASGSWLLLSETAARLLERYYPLRRRGAYYQLPLERPGGVALRGSGTLIGRHQELKPLQEAIAALAQRGAVGRWLVSGAAGMGKSRLVSEIALLARKEQVSVYRASASALHQPIAFSLLMALLEQVVGIDLQSDAKTRKTLLESYLLRHPRLNEPRFRAVAATLLGGAEQPVMPPSHTQMADALTLWLETLSTKTPTLLIFEDLHWADAASLVLLERLKRQPGQMILATSREVEPGWQTLLLEPLSYEQSCELVRALPAGAHISREHLERIALKAEGVPLFIEELVQARRWQPEGTEWQEPVLYSLQTLYGVRLRACGEAAALARFAAVVGVSFERSLLRADGDFEPLWLEQALSTLSQNGLIVTLKPGLYAFRHALIQEAVLASLDRAAVWALHLRVAEALQRLSGGRQERIAYHLERGRHPMRAIAFRLAAARSALLSGALQEAATQIAKAIEGLEALPEGQARDRQAYAVRKLEAEIWTALSGEQAPAARRARQQAAQLAKIVTE